MADTQELQRLALVAYKILWIGHYQCLTADCIADLRHLNRDHIYIDENSFHI